MSADPAPLSALEAQGQLKEALRKAWDRGCAESTPLALVLVGFDKSETAEGTDILQRALRVHCARTHDEVVRRSNNQYVAVLPDTSPSGARLIGDRIVEAMRLEDSDRAHRVSVGVAVAVPDDHRDASDLLRRAETSFDAAQSNGGDRCVGGQGSGSAKPPKATPSAFSTLGNIFGKSKKEEEFRRGTD